MKNKNSQPQDRLSRLRLGPRSTFRRRAGFTLVELVVAGVITAFVLGSVAMSIGQLGRAKNSAKVRFDAYIRADSALNAVRKDIVSVLRRDDLFYARFLLINDGIRVGDEQLERDEVVLFNTRLKALRDIDFNGEGSDYETQYRVVDDDAGPVLWVRHDGMPDEYPQGGGLVKPAVEGILALKFEAYDGVAWYDDWDSDFEGLPLAVRITVVSSGHRNADDAYTAPRATLRTVVAIDRVIPPKDLFKDPEEEEEEENAEEGMEEGEGSGDGTGDGGDGTGNGNGNGNNTGGGGIGGGGGGRPGGGGGGRPGGGGGGGVRPGGGGGNTGGGGGRPGGGGGGGIGTKPGAGGGSTDRPR